MAGTSTLHIIDSRDGQSYTVPVHNDYILAEDIGKIRPTFVETEGEEGDNNLPRPLRILDNGFQYTACMKSSITFIDGQRGEIRYRDHPIKQLFNDYVYEDVMHLLIWGKLPSQLEKGKVRAVMNKAAIPPQSVVDVIRAFPKDAETYPMIIAGMSAFAASDKAICDTHHQQKPMFHMNHDEADPAISRTIAYLATTIALIHCHKAGKPFTPPAPEKSLIGNLLLMMGINDPRVESCLDKLWILYADHEITNSTAAVLNAGSTLTDPTSSVISGIVSGYGPLHGGAIDLAYEAFRKIGTPENVPQFIEVCKVRKTRLFGYGHRIYKVRDPRVSLIQELMQEHEEALNVNPLLRVALAIDKVANSDPYFVSRGLKANADLLGTFLYTAMGFDQDMVIAITILSRTPGALAHWRESLSEFISSARLEQSTADKVASSTNQIMEATADISGIAAKLRQIERGKRKFHGMKLGDKGGANGLVESIELVMKEAVL